MRTLNWSMLVLGLVSIGVVLSQQPISPFHRRPHGANFRDPLVTLSGLGTGGFPVRTKNGEAQQWFNVGMKLAHAFYHDDAAAAFRKAYELDPSCALCAWGEAWVSGPNLNYDIPDTQISIALAHTQHAAKLAANGSPLERDLISALLIRYDANLSPKDRAVAFAKAMNGLSERHPTVDEVQVITAHSWLVTFRYDEQSGVERALRILETLLDRSPENTGAIHYYIHGKEFAGSPKDALPYALRLASLAPFASHLIHMASHSLLYVGAYRDIGLINASAMRIDREYESKLGRDFRVSELKYYVHNFMFGIFGALMSGDRDLILGYANHGIELFSPYVSDKKVYGALAFSYVAYGRFDPDKALSIPVPTSDSLHLRLVRHYARGEAYAMMGKVGLLQNEIDQIASIRAPSHELFLGPLVEMVRNVLEGRLAMLVNEPTRATEIFLRAATTQETIFKNRMDPPVWWYPIRRSMAAALLKDGKYEDAEREAQHCLTWFPKDALALVVLAKARLRQGDHTSGARYLSEAQLYWSGDISSVDEDLI